MSEKLDSTEAQRLNRLRILLGAAANRIGEESEPGLHAAVLSIDAAGELAIGLCLHKLGISFKPDASVPDQLNKLRAKFKDGIPGEQGYRELHSARNLVQHQGSLPSSAELPGWMAETEKLCGAIVEVSFGVSLSEVGAADGVSDTTLRALLRAAELERDRGEPKASFESSWKALESARTRLRSLTGWVPSRRPPVAGLAGSTGALQGMFDQVNGVSEQLEMYALTDDPGEWLWFRHRHSEAFNGPPPSLADAARAFVFVLSWVLRLEAYLARHGPDRWERWQERRRPPVTGRPDGPHLVGEPTGSRMQMPSGQDEEFVWTFQFSDVPEGEPDFSFAVSAQLREGDWKISNAYLDPEGKLTAQFPLSVSAPEALEEVRALIEASRGEFEERIKSRFAAEQLAEKLTEPFRAAIEEAGLVIKEIEAKPPDRSGGELRPETAEVWIDIEGPDESAISTFGKGLGESFERFFPEYVVDPPTPSPYRSSFRGVTVPASWSPAQVAAWVAEAAEFDSDRHHERTLEQERRETDDEQRMTQMRDALGET